MAAGNAGIRLGEERLHRLLEVGRTLVAELQLESVLRQVLETAGELTGASYAALGILDERKQELERFLYVGIDAETRREIGPLPRGRWVLGELIRCPEPLRLPDVTAHPRSYVNLAPSQGGWAEFTLDEDGTYPFVAHAFGDMVKGSVGCLRPSARRTRG